MQPRQNILQWYAVVITKDILIDKDLINKLKSWATGVANVIIKAILQHEYISKLIKYIKTAK